MKALKQHIFERLILSKTSRIPDGEFNINWATDSINKFKDYYKAMNEKHGFNLPDIAMTAKFRPIQVVYYDKLDPSDSDQNTFEWTIYKITENIKFSKLYDIIIKYFEDNTDLLDESLNERLVLSKTRNNFERDNEKFKYDKDSRLISNRFVFIYDYYLKRVKFDGYKELEDKDELDVFFISDEICCQPKGKLIRYTMTKVKDGETFKEVYDRIIDFFKENNILDESLNERLVISKNRNNSLKDDEKFIYDRKTGLINNGLTFIYDYYLERVKIDGYKKLEDNDIINVYFVGNIIYYKYKGKLTTYIMAEVKNGETFREVYDRMIDHIKDHNITLLE